MMSRIRLEYEVLVSGVYPIDGDYSISGFSLVKKELDIKSITNSTNDEVIFLNPLIPCCSINDSSGKCVYLVLKKDRYINIDYSEGNEYNLQETYLALEKLHLNDEIRNVEEALIITTNNDIKFPVYQIKAYNEDGKFITCIGDIMSLNIPKLIGNDRKRINEVCKRQETRLNSGLSFESIQSLSNQNKCFNHALSMYYSSFAVSDFQVRFILLITALESLLGIGTYRKPESCKECGQKKFEITKTISKNVGLVLHDCDDVICKRMKVMYKMRSNYVHNGDLIENRADQELQEYVRKVLLMYWFASIVRSTTDHKELIKFIQSDEYRKDIMIKAFLSTLGKETYGDKKEMVVDMILKQAMEAQVNTKMCAD